MSTDGMAGFPLSPQQARVWRLERDEGQGVYRTRAELRVRGDVSAAEIVAALRRFVDSHEILRTQVRVPPGLTTPLQVVEETAAGAVTVADGGAGDGSDGSDGAGGHGAEVPPWRMRVRPSGPGEHRIDLDASALFVDPRSVPALAAWLAHDLRHPTGADDHPEPLQYADLAAWLNELLEDDETRAGRDAWRRLDIGATLATTLPNAAAEGSFEPGTVAVPDAGTRAADRLAEALDQQRRDVLLAAWAALLARRAATPRPVIGVQVEGRDYDELTDAFGPLARTLPVPLPVDGDEPFDALVREVAERRREAESRQHFFAWPSLEADDDGGEPAAPFAAFGFVPHAEPEPEPVDEGEVTVDVVRASTVAERWSVALADEGEGLALLHDRSRVSGDTPRRIAEALAELLTEAARDPHRPVFRLPVAGRPELDRLAGLAGTVGGVEPAEPVLDTVLRRAAEKPDALAVSTESEDLDYGCLAAGALHLADRLRRRGVGPDVRVALWADRAVDTVIGILGVLAAGGAYVPLDPGTPVERQLGIARQAGCRLLVVPSRSSSSPPDGLVAAMEAVESARPEAPATGPIDPPTPPAPESLAYVVYTSGSTGRPKGVAVSHGALAAYLGGLLDRLAPPTDSTWASVTTLAADLAHTSLFGALATGGHLVVVAPETAGDARSLTELFHRHGVDYLKIVPSHLEALLLADPSPELLPRRGLISGGEAFGLALLARVRHLAPELALFNHYGPTETTVGALVHRVDQQPPDAAATVPVGLPLAHARVQLLDDHDRPAPFWVAAEIAIGGAALARGYLDAPGATAAAFVPDPTSAGPGERIYRTGDLGRRLDSGAIEFLGRRDDQVKIRGYRVEPGEVAAVLADHPAVERVAVVPRPEVGGSLVAYVVAAQGAAPDRETLGSFAAARLPEYMVPTTVVVLPALPRTPNGKLDRAALPAPELDRGHSEPPRNPREELLASIWCQVLERDRVGIHQSFFDLGGHSLLATQVIARVRDALGVDLQLQTFFAAPTVAGVAAAVGDSSGGEATEALEPIPRDGDLPLSFQQERLWFLDRLEPGNPFYNVSRAVRLGGELSVPVLARSLARLGERHESLRTSFHGSVSGAVARVAPAPASPVRTPVVDLSHLEPGRAAALAEELARQTVRARFDLGRSPLLEARLLRLASDDHLLVVSMHHVVSDGWSLRLLVQELAALYRAGLDGVPAQLPELAVQSADYAAWQRRHLAGERLERRLAYWRDHLDGCPPVLELPTDRPRPPRMTYAGEVRTRRLGAPLHRRLQELARGREATLFMVVLAAVEALVARWSGQDDFAIGTPIAGRDRVELERIVGFFANTLVLRAQVPPEIGFDQLVRRARRTTLDAHEHHDVPFEKLVEELQPRRDPGTTPLFQVLLVVGEEPRERLRLGELELVPIGTRTGTAKTDLLFGVAPDADGLELSCEYRTALFDPTTIDRLLGRLQRLLEEVVDDPAAAVWDLRLLGAAERHQLLVEHNDTARRVPDEGVAELFARRAAEGPDRPAVSSGDRTVTYGELAERAARLAAHLIADGTRRGEPVGVALDRSEELIVALLGLLYAGAAYVPLDREYPAERLAGMVEDAGVTRVVTTAAVARLLPSVPRWILIDEQGPAIAGRPPLPGPRAARGHDLAYVDFTSGSTGRPKGVAVPHRAIVRLLFGTDYVHLGPETTTLHLAPLSFDASTFEIWAPLVHGGRLVLLEPGPPSAEALARGLGQGVDTLWLTASLFNAVIDRSPAVLGDLRSLLTGGEALSVDHVRRALAALPETRLVNGYGPTESTTFACCFPARDAADGAGSIPIGRPIGNTRAHVTDARLAPLPLGAPGELLLGGPGLARGYAGEPRWTAERFVPDPFGAAGERLYRTGDRVVRRAAGEIDFLGRIDQQIKLRGFRIEPGEIETVLATHPDVARLAVVLRQDGDEPRLVAYVVPEAGSTVSTAALLEHARAGLPAHMVPATFVLLDELPRTPTGKLDRRALPAPEAARPELASAFRAPSAGLEATLSEIWCEVLDLDRVGLDDNFFDLGGHSLLLARVQDAVRERLGRDVELVRLFEHPTVGELAAALDSDVSAPEASPTPSTSPRSAPSTEPIAVVALGGRFPGARSVGELWENLVAGVDAITDFSLDDLRQRGIDLQWLDDPHYVPSRGVLDGADELDADFFEISPREAELMDPQQRLFLECAWEALEAAGCDPRRGAGPTESRPRIGVFAGSSQNDYGLHLYGRPEILASAGSHQLRIGNDKDFLPLRVSYKLDLGGPSVNVQSACSTSLLAVHLARRSLLAGDCDMALAGGASVSARQHGGYLYQEGSIGSPDGRCRPFDHRSSGIVSGKGVAVVVLKRLSDAVADGDRIHAVLRGSASNNDGARKIGFTAPSVEAQSAVVRDALEDAGISAAAVGMVEAHGTGTELGDPIEVTALARAFRGAGATGTGTCALGSIKSNIGHLDAAAGVAGLIKAVLAVEHGVLPPTVHFERPNPRLELDGSPFRVDGVARQWPDGPGPRTAGVSALGVGGTNVHVIVEQAPEQPPTDPVDGSSLLLVSARTASALDAATDRLAGWLASHPDAELADVAYTLQVGRRSFEHRRYAIAEDPTEAARVLRDRDRRQTGAGEPGDSRRPVFFLFPGQGAQRPGMGREVARADAAAGEEIDRAAELLRPELDLDLRDLLLADVDDESAAQALRDTAIAQTALFVVEHALAGVWMRRGIAPEALAGHSLGEWVAATVAGVFRWEDALRLVALRGSLMREMEPGAMLAVPLGEGELTERFGLPDGVELASLNAADRTVVSGPEDAIARYAERLSGERLPVRRLATSHGFHSAAMEPAVAPLVEAIEAVERREPSLPFASCVTGGWIDPQRAVDPTYWGRQMRAPVRFADVVGELLAHPRLLLEVGPGDDLTGFVRRHPAFLEARSETIVTLGGRRDAGTGDALLAAAGRLWLAGTRLDWTAFHEGRRRKVELPTYPFERERFWIDPPSADAPPSARDGQTKRPDVADWFYLPSWRPSAPLPRPRGEERCLVLSPDPNEGLGGRLAQRLERAGWRVAREASADLAAEADARRLILRLSQAGELPERIVFDRTDPVADDPELEIERGPLALLHLVGAWLASAGGAPVQILTVTTGAQRVTDGEDVSPERATLAAVGRVVSQEHPEIVCRVVDLPPVEPGAPVPGLDRLAAEVAAPPAAQAVVAHRGARRWVEAFEPIPLAAEEGGPELLREGGVYLITGGLGRIGRRLAHHLAVGWRARVALVGRSAASDGTGASSDDDWPRSIEEAGGEVMVLQADIADPAATARAIARVRQRYGPLHGVFHAAAITGDRVARPVAETGADDLALHLTPKLAGARSLAAALDGADLDFCLLFSSLSGSIGGLGLAAYGAANRAMDAFAAGAQETTGFPWISVAWDGWQLEEREAHAFGAGQAGLAMTPEEGLAACERALRLLGEDRVVVSTARLDARIRRWSNRAASGSGDPSAASRRRAAGRDRESLDAEPVLPRTPTEEAIAAIWRELLGVDDIGVEDDFFDLRGDSLLATQMVSRLRTELGVEIPLRALFEEPTIAGLAARAAGERPAAALPPLEPIPRDGSLPVSFGQHRLWFLDQLHPGSAAYNLRTAVRLVGPLDVVALDRTLEALVERQEILRTRLVEKAGEPRQVIEPRGHLPLPVVDLSRLEDSRRDREIDRLAAESAAQPFDLGTCPLLRLRLVRLDGDSHVLLSIMHHIISDGWSMALLTREIVALYEAFRQHEPADLPELTVQYADFASWQRSWLTDQVIDNQLAYWRRRLAGAPERTALPTDRPRPPVPSHRGGAEPLRLPPRVVEGLRDAGRQRGATLFMTLMAAFALLLRNWTGEDDLVIGTDVANRHHRETEGILGFFVNQLALRFDLAGQATFPEIVEHTRDEVLAATAHQDVPFERLVQLLDAGHDPAVTPLFQTKLVLQNIPLAHGSFEELSIEPIQTHGGRSKFDLLLNLTDSPDGLAGTLEYALDLFDRATAKRLADRFVRLLETVAESPDSTVEELVDALERFDAAEREASRHRRASLMKSARRKVVE